jgi:hypothetical protein
VSTERLLTDVIEQLTDDCNARFVLAPARDLENDGSRWERYPGW